MSAHANYLRITNPFTLTDPPQWWLEELARFDDQLVIFPSQKDPVFRLGRKSRISRGITPADVPGVQNHPDTVVMCTNGLVPVTTVMPGAIWDHRVFEKLAERDTWRIGGWKKTAELIETGEREQQEAIDRAHADKGDAIHSDAYASYKYRTGQRISMAHHGAANNKRSKPQHFLAPSSPPPTSARVSLA